MKLVTTISDAPLAGVMARIRLQFPDAELFDVTPEWQRPESVYAVRIAGGLSILYRQEFSADLNGVADAKIRELELSGKP